MQLRWVHSTALTIGICAPRSVPAPIPHQDLTLLDRFAPKSGRGLVFRRRQTQTLLLSYRFCSPLHCQRFEPPSNQGTAIRRPRSRSGHRVGGKAATAGAIHFTTSCSKAASHRFALEHNRTLVPLQKQSRNRSDAKRRHGMNTHVRIRAIALLASAFAVALALAAAFSSAGVTDAARKLVMEEFTIDAADPGIKLYVRNKRPEDMNHFTSDKTLLFVHGITLPSEATFDFSSRRAILDGLHRPTRLGCVPGGCAWLRSIDSSTGNGSASRQQSSHRHNRCGSKGCQFRNRLHPPATRYL